MRERERLRHFHNLPAALIRAKINGRADCRRAHVRCLLDGAEHDLVGLVRISEQFIMVDFDQERNLVRIFARDRAEHAVSGGDGIAAAFYGQLDDILGVEIIRVLRKARAR